MSAELMGLTAFLLALVVVSWAAQRLLRDRSFWLRYGVAIVAPAGLMLVVISFSFWGPLSLSVPPRPPAPPAPAAPSKPAAPGAISNSQFDPAAFIQEQVRKLVPGSILFNPPTRMRVGEPERITVRISRSGLEGAIKSDLQGRGVPRIEQIQVGTFMRVRLFGGGFEVTTHSDENQAVPEQGFAEWLFSVKPLSAGRRILDLQVAVRFELPNREEVTELPVLSREIAVEVNTWWSVKQLVSENWKWFLSGIGSVVVFIVGYFGKRWIERPKPSGSARPPRRRGLR